MAFITKDSPRIEQSHGLVPLMPHQLAMLHRCREIEQTNNVSIGFANSYGSKKSLRCKMGIMSDMPGSGKTYVILSLILMDPDSVNVIVVPQNIYSQWDVAIKTFCGSQVSYTKLITYNDVSALYFNPHLLHSQIILTTPLYYNVIMDALQGKRRIERIFIDEIDSVISIAQAQNNLCNMLWLISASVTYKMLIKMGFTFNNLFLTNDASTDTHINNVVQMVTCKTNEDFVKECLALPLIVETQVICHNVLVDDVLHGLITESEYMRLNALDYNGINKLQSMTVATNMTEAVKYFIADLEDMVGTLQICIKDIENALNGVLSSEDRLRLEIDLDGKRTKYTTTQQKIDCIRARLEECDVCSICYCDIVGKVVTLCCQNSFCGLCLTSWVTKTKHASCPTCRQNNVSVLTISDDDTSLLNDMSQNNQNECNDNKKTKLQELEGLFASSLGNKVIIFSDYTSIFKEISRMLVKKCIKYIELDGGSIETIDKHVTQYKHGDVRVLMTNSSLYGCGMNLQNTSDVVILHKVHPSMREQVIGRAQRPGREASLKVWELLHVNELSS